MTLELATALVRIKVDRSQLKAEIASARNQIIKGLSGIRVRVEIDAARAARDAKAAGHAAGKAAQQGFNQGFGMSRRGPSGMSTVQISQQMKRIGGPTGTGMIRRGSFGMMRGAIEIAPGQYLLPGPTQRRLGYTPSAGRGFGGGGGGFPPPPFDPSGARGGPGYGRGFGGSGGGFFGGRHGLSGTSGGSGFAAGLGFAVSPRLASLAVFGGAPAAAGGALGGALVGATKAFADFEKEFRRVEVVQREAGATEESIKKLEEQARLLGKTTIFSATEAAQAMVVLTQKGFDAEQVFKSLPNVLNLAAAGQIDIADSAKIVGSAMKQFGMDASQATRIVDVIAKASLTSATDVNQLGTALSYVGNIAHMSDKDLEETTAALMVLSDAGLEASRAGTGLTQVLAKLSDPKKAEAFREIGVEIGDVNGKMKPLAQIVDETNRAMQGMTALQKTNFAFKAFGQRGGPAFGALIEKGGSAIRQNQSGLSGSSGTAQRTASAMMDTLKEQFKNLIDVLGEVGIKLGKVFSQALSRSIQLTAESVELIGKAFAGMSNSIQILGLDIILKNLLMLGFRALTLLLPLIELLNQLLKEYSATTTNADSSWRSFLKTLSMLNPFYAVSEGLGQVVSGLKELGNTTGVLELAWLNLEQTILKTLLALGTFGLGDLTEEAKRDFEDRRKQILRQFEETDEQAKKRLGIGKNGNVTDNAPSGSPSVAGSGSPSVAGSKTSLVSIGSAWSRIQEGLGKTDYQKQIADNTREIADNTKPKGAGGGAGADGGGNPAGGAGLGAAIAGGAAGGMTPWQAKQQRAAEARAKRYADIKERPAKAMAKREEERKQQAEERQKREEDKKAHREKAIADREARKQQAAESRKGVLANIAKHEEMVQKGEELRAEHDHGSIREEAAINRNKPIVEPRMVTDEQGKEYISNVRRKNSYESWLTWTKIMMNRKPGGVRGVLPMPTPEELKLQEELAANRSKGARSRLGKSQGRGFGMEAEIKGYSDEATARRKLEEEAQRNQNQYKEPVQTLDIYKMRDALEQARKLLYGEGAMKSGINSTMRDNESRSLQQIADNTKNSADVTKQLLSVMKLPKSATFA